MSDLSILKPTYYGYIGNTEDAILVIQAVLNKQLEPVTRRLDPKERSEVIILGNVFAFIEQSSNIKRWTDGKRWSASRILGRFLMYRELDDSNPYDNQSRGKRKKPSGTRSYSDSNYLSSSYDAINSNMSEVEASEALANLNGRQEGAASSSSRPLQRTLRQGTDTMDYRSGYIACPAKHDSHLIKKTISFMVEVKDEHGPSAWRNVHLISYFSPMDVVSHTLVRPTATKLASTPISTDLQEAVDKVLLHTKPAPGDLEAYFLDSKYQLLKLLTPMKVLPALSQYEGTEMEAKLKRHLGQADQMKADNGVSKSLLPDQRHMTGFMDPQMYSHQYGALNGVANDTTFRGDANVPHLLPTPQSIGSSLSMPRPMVVNQGYSGGASGGLDGTIYNPSSQATQTLSSSSQTSHSTQIADSLQSQSNPQVHGQHFQAGNSFQSVSTQPLQFSQSIMARPMALPISMPGSAGGQAANQRLGSGSQYTRAEQHSPQQGSLFQGSAPASSNGLPVYFPSYSNTYGYRPELDSPMNMHRRFYTDYHVANVHPTPMGSYSLGHDQPLAGSSMFASGHEVEPNLERQDFAPMGRRLDSPLGFELSSSFYRAPKTEDIEVPQHYDENYQRI